MQPLHSSILRMPTASARSVDVVAIAASLGGLNALSRVLADIPADFPAAIIVVQHLSARYPSALAEILNRRATLPVAWAAHGAVLRPGTVTVAPPDRHLLVAPDGALILSNGAKVQCARPAADRLFASVARQYGERAIAVVLTGTLGDGAAGVRAIKGAGGQVLAQDAATSAAFGMPGAAIATGCVDAVLPLGRIAAALIELTRTPKPGARRLFAPVNWSPLA